MNIDRIERQITLSAPLGRVWRALADHREFGQWFRLNLEGPFEVGKIARGRITHPGYEHLQWEALVEKIEPKSYFAFAWHPYAVDPSVDYSKEPRTLVEFRLKATKDGTHLTVTESGFEKIPAERRAEAIRMDGAGWTVQMENIKHHVAPA